jgi:ribosome-binding protein aMBF1 (putative translation factor)
VAPRTKKPTKQDLRKQTLIAQRDAAHKLVDQHRGEQTARGFASRLRDTRKECGLSMRDFALRSGLTQPTITGYELMHSFPPLHVAERMAKALNVNVCWLAYGIGIKEASL